ncbi:MAG TPA: lipoprotein [Chitinophagaceae bacterium]|nr:lipoprotein [Chitinophagaceae bacterium]
MKKILLPFLALLLLAACSNYGKKVKSGSIEVYYKEGVTETEAQKTADMFDRLIKETNPSSTQRKSFQLSKPSDTVLLKMVVDKDKMGQVGDESFYAIATMVSDSIYSGKPVNLELTNDQFKAIKTFTFKKAEEVPAEEKVE